MNTIINKSIYMFRVVFCLMCVVCCLSSCNDDDDTSLSAVTNLSYEPTMGGAIITFTAPANNDLLYVKAAYTNSMGDNVYRTTSIYDNKIEIDGLADETKTYPVYVSAVDKWGGETSASVINVTPNRSYINIIQDHLELRPMCGGLSVLWINPMGIESQDEITSKNPGKAVYVVVDYTDSAGVTRTRYLTSKLREAKARIRGLMAGHYDVTFHVEDFAGNKTAQSVPQNYLVPAETEFPKFVEVEDPKSGTIKKFYWEMIARLTTLQPAWEYTNESIFDGIIDSNTKDTRNYAGTDCDGTSNITGAKVSYGAAIPWDTDQVDIVIDMHQVVSISRLKGWQRCFKYGSQPYSGRAEDQTNGISDDYDYYQPDNLKRFKVFGSMTLNEDDWFLIKDCDIATNTTAGPLPIYWTNPDYFGREVYMPNNASYQAALEGHEWELDEMTDSVRYIRVRFVENWDLSKRGVSGLSELNLYGQQLLTPEELAAKESE